MSAPRSEYSKYWPGAANSGVEMTAARASSGVCAMRQRSRPAGRPERCSSSMRIVTCSFAAAGELGDVLHDLVVEAELPLVEQDHDGGRGADDLRQRREIIDRPLGDDRPGVARPAEPAEALLPDRGALAADDDRGTGIAAGADAALDDAIDRRQARGGHADGAGRLGRQPVAGRRRRPLASAGGTRLAAANSRLSNAVFPGKRWASDAIAAGYRQFACSTMLTWSVGHWRGGRCPADAHTL